MVANGFLLHAAAKDGNMDGSMLTLGIPFATFSGCNNLHPPLNRKNADAWSKIDDVKKGKPKETFATHVDSHQGLGTATAPC